jgi:hypothetical protein
MEGDAQLCSNPVDAVLAFFAFEKLAFSTCAWHEGGGEYSFCADGYG